MTEPAGPTLGRIENRLEFETLISDTSASLLSAPPAELDLAVERALEGVRRFFQADRCAILSVSADQQVVQVRLESCAEGVAKVSPDINLVPVFPWSWKTLLVERAPVRVSRMADLPAGAGAERQGWANLPIRSALTLPIETRQLVRHLIVLNTVHEEREWPEAYVRRLRVLGEMLAGALERQEMFIELREAEQRMSLAADSAEAGLWTLDYASGIFWSTERARAIFGYSSDEVIDVERLRASLHPDDRGLVLGAIERSAQAGEPIDEEYRIILPEDGRARWIASRGRPQFTPEGRPERLMGVSIDVTDRKHGEAALETSEARLAAGADLAELAFYEVDFASGDMYVDDRIRDVCGIPGDRAQGLEALEFWMEQLHPEDRERLLDARQRLHDGALDRLSLVYRYRHPTRGERWFAHVARVAARDATGRTLKSYGVLRDITDLKRSEEDLRDLSRRLIRAHEEERALLARELHDDLTQRLALLAIDAGRAELTAPEGPQTEAMKTIREGLVRLSEDVHSLAYQLHPSVLEELGLAEALRTECGRIEGRGEVELAVTLDPLPPAVGKDVALCLFRVAQEALNNVIRHADARAARVTLRQRDGGLLLAVDDRGVGFDPENSGKPRHLGLASMRERVHLARGTLEIQSAPGKGTTVRVWVPVEGESR